MPGHPRIWLGPTRRHGNKFLRDELSACQANIESSLLLNISTSYIEGSELGQCFRGNNLRRHAIFAAFIIFAAFGEMDLNKN